MLLELTARWPFVRRTAAPTLAPAVYTTGAHTPHGVPAHAHRSWVKTPDGVGWLHHHESGGWIIELERGGLVKLRVGEFTHIEAPT